ncbi:MAG: hypothetical protein AAB588_01305 [Patescibacteria group bacterium]
MNRDLVSLLRITAGLVILFFGLIGLVVPILQGWILILIAIPLISPKHGKMMVEKLKEWKTKWFHKKPKSNF